MAGGSDRRSERVGGRQHRINDQGGRRQVRRGACRVFRVAHPSEEEEEGRHFRHWLRAGHRLRHTMLGFPLNEEDDLERWLREPAPAQGVAPEAAPPMPVDDEPPPAPLPNSMRYDTRPMPLTPELEETTMAIPAGLPRNDFGAAIGDHPGNRAQLLKMMGDNSRRTFTPDEMALMPKGFQNIATPSQRPEINPEMRDPAAGDLPNTRARNDLVTGRPQMPRQRQAPDTLAGTQSGRRSSGGGFLGGIDPAIALAAFGAAVGKPNLMSAGAIRSEER